MGERGKGRDGGNRGGDGATLIHLFISFLFLFFCFMCSYIHAYIFTYTYTYIHIYQTHIYIISIYVTFYFFEFLALKYNIMRDWLVISFVWTNMISEICDFDCE